MIYVSKMKIYLPKKVLMKKLYVSAQYERPDVSLEKDDICNGTYEIERERERERERCIDREIDTYVCTYVRSNIFIPNRQRYKKITSQIRVDKQRERETEIHVRT